ncbi:glutathione s-transferase t3 [Quercus suber]|uniref:Glutathione s-transferase t3 n=1 Tax=Quercus suber TaxID=58331 RepID=A0AAW0JKG1_QUESU
MRPLLQYPFRGSGISVEEDNLLVLAWFNISLDVVFANGKKHKTLWHRIWLYFHDNKQFESNRSENSLRHRWSVIKQHTSKFCGCLAQVETLNSCGKTEQDKISYAKLMYKNNNKTSFQFEHC